MILPAPHIRLLVAAYQTLEPIDWLTDTGVDGLTLRHMRHRFSTSSEKPCLSLRWTGNNDPGTRGEYLNAWERPREMGLDLIIDMALPTELSGDDPTGWEKHSRIAARAMTAFQTQGDANFLYPLLCDWIVAGDDSPDEDSKPDDARLVKSLSVLYRVRVDDENVLLAQGVNAT